MTNLKNPPFFLSILCFLQCFLPALRTSAQDTTTIYFDAEWNNTTKDNGYYYRKAWKTGKDGLWTIRDYYPTHVLQMSGYTYNPDSFVSEGHAVYYYPNGKKDKECDYEHEKIIGICQTWYESGQVKDSGAYKNGEQTGEWKEWYENGKLAARGSYKEGNETGEWRSWHENGNPGDVGSYIDGKKTGAWKKLYDNGQLYEQGNYADDKETGEWKYGYENGKMSATGKFDKGQATGSWKGWHENGQKSYETYYLNGDLDSTGTWYHENGQRSSEEFYAKGMLISSKYWDEAGKPVPVKDAKDRKPYFGDEINTALWKYINTHVNYPKEARKKNISGQVEIKFMIDTDGSVKDAAVTTAVDPLLDAEALRVISGMPKWVPGREHNRPVKVFYTLPITFELQ